MEDNLKLSIKGEVFMYQSGVLINHIKNHIKPASMDIIRRCIATGQPTISSIKVFDGSSELAEANLSGYSFPGTGGAVRFRFILTEESFEGDFDGLELLSSDGLVFSKIESIGPISKTFDNQIIIEWVLTLEIITS